MFEKLDMCTKEKNSNIAKHKIACQFYNLNKFVFTASFVQNLEAFFFIDVSCCFFYITF